MAEQVERPRLRIVVTGDRKWTDEWTVRTTLETVLAEAGIESDQVYLVNGGARGLDLMARRVALKLGMIVNTIFAQWERYGKGAGHIRNTAMLDTDPDIVLAFHDRLENGSKGTKNCVEQAKERGIPVFAIVSKEVREATLEKDSPPTQEEIDTEND